MKILKRKPIVILLMAIVGMVSNINAQQNTAGGNTLKSKGTKYYIHFGTCGRG